MPKTSYKSFRATKRNLYLFIIVAIIVITFILVPIDFQKLKYNDKQTKSDEFLIRSSDWDVTEWDYKINITLTPATSEPDYQIRIDLNPSNFNYSKAKIDGGDIRFSDLSQNIIDYWIESWHPMGTSTIWVKIPSSGTSTIYMYYGNPSAVSLSNGTNTFIFFDDFEGISLDSSKWDTEIGSYCGITVSSGYVRVYSATPSAFVEYAEVGFTDFDGQQGVPFSGYYTNGHARARPLTDTSWFTGEIRALNSTYAPFYKNDVFDSIDTGPRTAPLPARFLSHSCVGGSGAPYFAYISSTNITLGVDNRAIRFLSWINLESIADFRMDWVFIFKYNELNPIVSIGYDVSKPSKNAWRYKREIIITPATPEPEYQIRIDLNPSNFNYSNTKSNGGDIRFSDSSHSILDYWIESWNPTGNSIIWVKIPTSGTSTIYMYYGNPNAVSLSNGNNTFIFFDDFEGISLDFSKWDAEIGSYCGITVSSGYVRVYSATSSAFVEFAEVGFTDLEGQQGVPFSGYYTNGHARARPLTDTTWFTGEIRILNSTYAPFYKNDIFDSADTDPRTGPLPARFLSHSCVGGSGAPYWAYISSINPNLGINNRAIRFLSWVDLEGITDYRMDWVFVYKFNELNPTANLGGEITIYDKPPEIIINLPLPGKFFSNSPPNFHISIIDINLNPSWYSIDNGVNNITLKEMIGTIDEMEWNKKNDEPVIISFYANSSWGYIGCANITVIKDTIVPLITIYEPLMSQIYGYNSPIFNISIDDQNLDSIWYTTDGGLSNYSVLDTYGAIDQEAWNDAIQGNIAIIFYAKDKAGNVGYKQVIVIKNLPSSATIGIPGINLYILSVIILIGVLFLSRRSKRLIH